MKNKLKSKNRLIKDIGMFTEFMALYIPPQSIEAAEVYARVMDGVGRFLKTTKEAA